MFRVSPHVLASWRPAGPIRGTLRTAQLYSTDASNTKHQNEATQSESRQEENAQSKVDSVKRAQGHTTNIDTQSTEYSKSGSDDAVAALQNVSFSTSGQAGREKNRAGRMSNDPLEVSPANRSVSETTSEVDGQAEPSGRKSPTQAEPSFYSESLGKTKSSNQKKEFKGFDRRKKEEKERVHVFGPGSR